MELNLGFVDNNNQLTVATLENNQIKTTDSISLSDEQKDVDTDNSPSNLFGIVYEGELPTVDLGDPLFISSKNNLPLSPCMSYEEIFTKVKEHTNHQSLREITKTLENIFILSDQFQSLYNQSRNQFFKEIWLIIRRSFLTQH